MLGHTKKHRIEDYYSIPERAQEHISSDSIDWRDAVKDVFDDVPGPALNLRGLRNREGLTQAELGQVVGIEQSNVSKMERGKRQISAKIAKRLEKKFHIDYRLFL